MRVDLRTGGRAVATSCLTMTKQDIQKENIWWEDTLSDFVEQNSDLSRLDEG